ncbi:hypothetical protein [Mangrovicella endophytica]|uniref:hypothetical protein n=1 Tax=Mangrovicella endophytica TaxID=2066697 RepID=UPI0013000DC2
MIFFSVSRFGQIEPALDALDTFFQAIDTAMNAGKIFLDSGESDLHVVRIG